MTRKLISSRLASLPSIISTHPYGDLVAGAPNRPLNLHPYGDLALRLDACGCRPVAVPRKLELKPATLRAVLLASLSAVFLLITLISSKGKTYDISQRFLPRRP